MDFESENVWHYGLQKLLVINIFSYFAKICSKIPDVCLPKKVCEFLHFAEFPCTFFYFLNFIEFRHFIKILRKMLWKTFTTFWKKLRNLEKCVTLRMEKSVYH